MHWSTRNSNGVSPGKMAEQSPTSDDSDLDDTVSWGTLLTETRRVLESCGVSENPRQEAKWILEEVTGASGADFVDAMDRLATVRGVARLDALVARRRSGEPIQYVLGHWAFRTLDLLVDKRVLIPRPETEVVVGLAISELDRLERVAPRVVDLGTGSGAIGLSIAVERPEAIVSLTDRSGDALAVARANLVGLGRQARNVTIEQGEWFSALPETQRRGVDVIVSNPPYIPNAEALDSSVADWEPSIALRAGDDGLDDLRLIVAQSVEWLADGGVLVLEMGTEQTAAVCELAEDAGFAAQVHKDLAGKDRAVVARLGG